MPYTLAIMNKSKNVIIRKAENKDFNSIFLLLKQLWSNKKLNKTTLKKVYSRLLNSDNEEAWCAEINRQIVGFCTLSIRNSLWQESRMGHICELIVDEPFRGQKIGTKLIKKANNIAKKRGCKKIELDSAFHRKEAHSLYEKLGFKNRAYLFSKNP
jgi:ribosomal protein S18 acetylase RimI-like enzyme